MVSAVRTSFFALSAPGRGVAASGANKGKARNATDVDNGAIKPMTGSNGSGGQEGAVADGDFTSAPGQDVSVAEGGIRPVSRPVDTPYLVALEPGDADADEDGRVAILDVGAADRLVRMRQAKDLYRSNLKVVEVTRDMKGSFLNDRA